MIKKITAYVLLFLIIPAAIILGATVFGNKQTAFITLVVTAAACVPFFISFEKNKSTSKTMIIVAVMVAVSVIGRIAFAVIPAFKPITAIVIITALTFGKEAGFMTGALSAVISNFYFAQGPWTPFQMFTWGIIGFIAGALAEPLKRHRLLLLLYGALSGIAFSLMVDVWTVLWYDGGFNAERYITSIAAALPFMAMYAVSNVIFLLLLAKPVGKKLDRIKLKYGL